MEISFFLNEWQWEDSSLKGTDLVEKKGQVVEVQLWIQPFLYDSIGVKNQNMRATLTPIIERTGLYFFLGEIKKIFKDPNADESISFLELDCTIPLNSNVTDIRLHQARKGNFRRGFGILTGDVSFRRVRGCIVKGRFVDLIQFDDENVQLMTIEIPENWKSLWKGFSRLPYHSYV